MTRVPAFLLMLLPVAAHAQQATEMDATTAPALQTELPAEPAQDADPGRAVAEDPTSLTGRGGPSLRANRTFQGAIGTSIYTPIGTPIGTRMGVPH